MHDLSIADLLVIFRRRRDYFIVTSGIVMLLTLLYAFYGPQYRAAAVVEIRQSYVPASITNLDGANAINSAAAVADRRISQIGQRVTADESLAAIIKKLNLYPGANPERVSRVMRGATELKFIGSTVANPVAAQRESVEQLSAIAFEVSFTYRDPELTKQAIDEIVARLIEEDKTMRQYQAEQTASFLDAQLAQLEGDIEDKEQKIAQFRSKHGESGPSAVLFNQQASLSNSMNLQNVENQIVTNEALLGTLRGQLATLEPYLPMVEDGKTILSSRARLKQLQAELAALSGRYGPDHPDLVKLRAEIKSLKAQGVKLTNKTSVRDADNPTYLQIAAQISAAQSQQKALLAQRKNLKQQKAKYESALAKNPVVEQQLSQLTLDLDNAKERYRELKNKKLAAAMKQTLESGENGELLSVINPASIPTDTTPPRLLIVLGGFTLAMLAGLGAVMIVETLHQSVHSASQLTKIVGTAPLVRIPYIQHEAITPNETKRLLSPKTIAKDTVKIESQNLDRPLIPLYLTHGKDADTFRILRTQILQIVAQGNLKTIGITSPNHGDGKTTIALSLAASIAMDVNQTVLLVDLDLRKPNVTEYLGLTAPCGLTDYFDKNVPIADCLIRLMPERLSLLPAGHKLNHSSEVLGSPKIAALAEEIKTRYADRLVIYDLPPVLEQDDPLVLASHMDGVLLVVNEGCTRVEGLRTALHTLANMNIIGTVLNDSKSRRKPDVIERRFAPQPVIA